MEAHGETNRRSLGHRMVTVCLPENENGLFELEEEDKFDDCEVDREGVENDVEDEEDGTAAKMGLVKDEEEDKLSRLGLIDEF